MDSVVSQSNYDCQTGELVKLDAIYDNDLRQHVLVTYRCDHKFYDWPDCDEPVEIVQLCSSELLPESGLAQLLSDLLGRPLGPSELQTFDLHDLVGTRVQLALDAVDQPQGEFSETLVVSAKRLGDPAPAAK